MKWSKTQDCSLLHPEVQTTERNTYLQLRWIHITNDTTLGHISLSRDEYCREIQHINLFLWLFGNRIGKLVGTKVFQFGLHIWTECNILDTLTFHPCKALLNLSCDFSTGIAEWSHSIVFPDDNVAKMSFAVEAIIVPNVDTMFAVMLGVCLHCYL